MKKVFILFAVAGFMVSCNNSAETADTAKDSLDSIANAKKDVIDSSAQERKDMIDSTTEAKKEMLDSTGKKDTVKHK